MIYCKKKKRKQKKNKIQMKKVIYDNKTKRYETIKNINKIK